MYDSSKYYTHTNTHKGLKLHRKSAIVPIDPNTTLKLHFDASVKLAKSYEHFLVTNILQTFLNKHAGITLCGLTYRQIVTE